MSVVTFKQDLYPYCAGDTVNLDKDEKKRIDGIVKARDLRDVYVSGESDLKRTDDSVETRDLTTVPGTRDDGKVSKPGVGQLANGDDSDSVDAAAARAEAEAKKTAAAKAEAEAQDKARAEAEAKAQADAKAKAQAVKN